MSEKIGNGWEGLVSGLCPVQGEGTVDGCAWYFRARGNQWEFEVNADPKITADDVAWSPFWRAEAEWGTGHEAGYMPEEEAWDIIRAAIVTFRDRGQP